MAAQDIATLMANTHVEQRLVLKAALDSEFIDLEQFERYGFLVCAAELRELTTHALSTREYLKTQTTEYSQSGSQKPHY